MADVVYLVRHAAPPEAQRGRYWGWADPGVMPEGLDGLSALAGVVCRGPDRLFASPLARAALSAERLGRAFGVTIEFLPELAEADFGDFDGLNFLEIEQRYPDAARQWGELLDGFAFPGGEAVADFLVRAAGAWRSCLEVPEDSVMAVTHGGVISVWICLFLGIPLERRFMFRPDYGALTVFVRKRDDSGWEMDCFNNVPQPIAAKP